MAAITNPNPDIRGLELYDDAGHQVVKARAKNVTTDSTAWPPVTSGDLGIDVEVSIAPTANQRVNAQSGDFVAGSLVDLATLLTLAGTPTDANTINSLMGRLTKLRDLLNALAYDNTNEVKTSVYGKGAGAAGDTPLLLDSSGRPIIGNVVQISGQAPTLDNTSVLAVSMRGKGTAAGDTALLLDTLGQMTIEDFIRYQIMAGHGFHATTGLIATGAGNAYVGMQAIINNVAKNILIYNILCFSGSGAASTDARLYQNALSTADAALSTSLLTSIKNQQPASATASVMSALWGSPASTTQVGSFVGTQVDQAGVSASGLLNFLQNPSIMWFKAGDVASVAAYMRVTTSANSAAVSMDWIEF